MTSPTSGVRIFRTPGVGEVERTLMKTFLMTLILIVLVFYGLVLYLERVSIFYPKRELVLTPQQVGLSFEDVYFKTRDDVKLNGWLVKSPGASAMVLFAHGNGGNIGDRMEKIQRFHALGVNVFVFDYRGYGRSEGKPTEKGIYSDTLAAYDYLARRPDLSSRFFIAYGESLGGAPTVELAVRRHLAGLIVDSSFSSARDMAQKMYPYLPTFLMSVRMNSADKIKTVTVPKLFIHSQEDEIVPYQLGRKLFDAAPEPKEFLTIRGGHNDAALEDKTRYWQGIENFLQENGMIKK